jgi:hypothetical protein
MKQPLTFAAEPSVLVDASFMEFGYQKAREFFIALVAGADKQRKSTSEHLIAVYW